jgi:Na+-translocating ferredoxin:NAD+ oxidoreductase RnfG subunit
MSKSLKEKLIVAISTLFLTLIITALFNNLVNGADKVKNAVTEDVFQQELKKKVNNSDFRTLEQTVGLKVDQTIFNEHKQTEQAYREGIQRQLTSIDNKIDILLENR